MFSYILGSRPTDTTCSSIWTLASLAPSQKMSPRPTTRQSPTESSPTTSSRPRHPRGTINAPCTSPACPLRPHPRLDWLSSHKSTGTRSWQRRGDPSCSRMMRRMGRRVRMSISWGVLCVPMRMWLLTVSRTVGDLDLSRNADGTGDSSERTDVLHLTTGFRLLSIHWY